MTATPFIYLLYYISWQRREIPALSPPCRKEVKTGATGGGVPIGAALVSDDGKLPGREHNMCVQKGNAVMYVSY